PLLWAPVSLVVELAVVRHPLSFYDPPRHPHIAARHSVLLPNRQRVITAQPNESGRQRDLPGITLGGLSTLRIVARLDFLGDWQVIRVGNPRHRPAAPDLARHQEVPNV